MDHLPHRLSPAQARLEILHYLLTKGAKPGSKAFEQDFAAMYGVVSAAGEKAETLAIRSACLRLALGRGIKPSRPAQLLATVDALHDLAIGAPPAPAPAPAAGNTDNKDEDKGNPGPGTTA